MARDERANLFLAEPDLNPIVIDDDRTLQNLGMRCHEAVQLTERHLVKLIRGLFVHALLNGQQVGRPVLGEAEHVFELGERHPLVGQFLLDERDVLLT